METLFRLRLSPCSIAVSDAPQLVITKVALPKRLNRIQTPWKWNAWTIASVTLASDIITNEILWLSLANTQPPQPHINNKVSCCSSFRSKFEGCHIPSIPDTFPPCDALCNGCGALKILIINGINNKSPIHGRRVHLKWYVVVIFIVRIFVVQKDFCCYRTLSLSINATTIWFCFCTSHF